MKILIRIMDKGYFKQKIGSGGLHTTNNRLE
jgi:hypothetical protein